MTIKKRAGERRVPWMVHGLYGPGVLSYYDSWPLGRRLLRHDQDRRKSEPAPAYTHGAMEAANALSHLIAPGSWKLDLRDEAASIISAHTHDRELIEALERIRFILSADVEIFGEPNKDGIRSPLGMNLVCAQQVIENALRAAKGER